MTRPGYLLTAVLIYLLTPGCQPFQREEQATGRLKPLHETLASLKEAQDYDSERAYNRLRERMLNRGREPADTLLLFRAKQLMQQARQAMQLLSGPMPVDTLRQQLLRLDRQALLLGKVTPYSGTERIAQYLDLLAERQQVPDTSTLVLAGLQLEIVRHTTVVLHAATKQLESRSPHRSLLIPVIRQSPDRVRAGEPLQVEVFPLEIFVFSPEWQPAMYANGQRMPVINGVGKIRFKVTGPPGSRHWEGRFAFRRPGAGDTSLYKRFDYVVLPE